jgi:hypothetical protein
VRTAGDDINPPAPFKQNKEYLGYYEEVIGCDAEVTRVHRRNRAYDLKTGAATEDFGESGLVQKGRTRGFPFDLDSVIGVYAGKSIAETLAEGPTAVTGEKDGMGSTEE